MTRATLLPPPTADAVARAAHKLGVALRLFVEHTLTPAGSVGLAVALRAQAREQALVVARLLEDRGAVDDAAAAWGIAAMLRSRREKPGLLATAEAWCRDLAATCADEKAGLA